MMKSENPKNLQTVDFFFVEPKHYGIHERLENWARWCEGRRHGWMASPMFRLPRSNSRQWHAPELRSKLNELDGQALEKAVYALPELNRDALRWNYVGRSSPAPICRMLGTNYAGLAIYIRDGRQMLINRGA